MGSGAEEKPERAPELTEKLLWYIVETVKKRLQSKKQRSRGGA